MSKYDPSISQEARVRMRGWRDGDMVMVNGRTSRFNSETMKWSVIEEVPTDEWLDNPEWKHPRSFRVDGSPYKPGSIFSEDAAVIAGRIYFGNKG